MNLEPDSYKEFEKHKAKCLVAITKAIQKLKKKIIQLNLQLNKCLNWMEVQHKGNLIKANLSKLQEKTSVCTVWDWQKEVEVQLELDPHKSVKTQMVDCFKDAKRLERGIQPLRHQIEKTSHELVILENKLQKIVEAENIHELDFINPMETAPKTSPIIQERFLKKKKPSSVYIEFTSANGTKIWVGRHAKANDELTFRLSNGRDGWLHVHGYSGSHVVIRLDKETKPDLETLKDAMQLALHYSKARNRGEAEVLHTLRKFVSRSKGSKAGQVNVSKHSVEFVRFDPNRFQALKERGSLLDHS